MYECLTDANRIRAFTQADSRFDKSAGGEFSMFGGSISGTNVELVEEAKIVQKWRFRYRMKLFSAPKSCFSFPLSTKSSWFLHSNWAEGVFSNVTITIEEPNAGSTIVKLKQTGVPEADGYGNQNVYETTERGRRENVFQRIRMVFGFGV